ncbi:MAG: aldehyde dehydrogenase family protein [Alphaproteobacteria bacterium]|nr:aldehyde dehydrogenase family protein [Alphaproteobacteria bacterium]
MPDTARPADSAVGEREIARLFALQRQAFLKDPYPSREARLSRLDALLRLLDRYENDIVKAISADFGSRASEESLIAEVIGSISTARFAKKNLARWMRPRKVPTPLHLAPARSRLEPQPLGVVGIVSPWNYPVQLALGPAAAAFAAGNRILIKPSELTPRTSDLLKKMISEEFDESVAAVIVGGPETGAAFAAVPFDHLIFTGSTTVGRKVAEAAARNLTPVTLELGGKSPVILDPSADLARAGRSIAYGKMLNAGQTCIAPDYILAPKDSRDAAVDAIAAAARDLYPEIDTTADYTSIVSDRHFERLKAMVEEARAAGARIVEVGSSNALHPQRKMPLTIVVEPPPELRMMKEEIFGPILPVLSVASTDEAIEHVNSGDRPLALYWFGEDVSARDKVLMRTVSGGVTVNDTLMHFAQERLPFGGVGQSGMGAYHGDKGFETFSHMKPVFYQSKMSGGKVLQPPFTPKTHQALKFIRKII